MLHSGSTFLGRELLSRLTLLVNHLLGAEPAATQRLLQHCGKRLRVELTDWPALLPVPPVAVFVVTPAGLLEWCDDFNDDGDARPELQLCVAAANPVQLLILLAAGVRPEVSVQGEAQFAADMHWLAENLRWDLEADLARVMGPLPARQLAILGAAVAAGLRRWAPAASKP